MIGVAFISDREDLYLLECVSTFDRYIGGRNHHPMHVVDDREHQLGMAGAVREAWAWALRMGCDYLFHVEEDFRFTRPLQLGEMVSILEANPHLAQVVLKRQAWNDDEKVAGGIVEANPDDYEQKCMWFGGPTWTEHERIFSLNPCLIPRSVLELGWPSGNEAEFTRMCLDAGLKFAFYGGKFDAPRVTHVGHVRGNGWRL